MSQYILKCQFEQRPIKIIVTYDSYRKVREILEGMKLFDTFHMLYQLVNLYNHVLDNQAILLVLFVFFWGCLSKLPINSFRNGIT